MRILRPTVSAFSRLEQLFERAVEGTVRRVFRPGLHPVDIARRVERALDDARRPGLRGDIAPNRFVIRLSVRDEPRYRGLEAQLAAELRGFVRDLATERDYRFIGPISVSFEWEDGRPRGSVDVVAETVESERSAAPTRSAKAEAPPAPAPPTPAAPAEPAAPSEPVASEEPAAVSASPATESQAPADEVSRPPEPVSDATMRIPLAALRGQPMLIIDGGHLERRVPIVAPSTAVGRDLENDIVIDDQRVSRRHLRIVLEGEEVVIEDLQSTNGTYVNGRRIHRASLKDGDELNIGGVPARFIRNPA